MLPVLFALALAPASPSTPPSGPPLVTHEDELQAYGQIMGVAQAASDLCPGMLVNQDMMQEMKERWHLVPEDKPKLLEILNAKIAEMTSAAKPDPTTWCDKAYRAYGPD